MALSFIRLSRNPIKCLSNDFYISGINVGTNKVSLRQNCCPVSLNTEYNNYLKSGCKEMSERNKNILFNSDNQKRFLSSFGLTRYPLKAILPLNLDEAHSKLLVKLYSTNSDGIDPPKLSNKEKLKRAVKEYGVTVIVFHTTISLLSLGCCYLAVTSGLNLGELIGQAGLNGSSEIATGASLFVVAYAVHKVFAPVRIFITLAATPVIVRYLRKINVLKPPQPKSS